LLVFYEGRHKGLQDGEMLESILDEVSWLHSRSILVADLSYKSAMFPVTCIEVKYVRIENAGEETCCKYI
jgi:hypothetical protein